MVFVGTIGRYQEKLTPLLGGRGVSSALTESDLTSEKTTELLEVVTAIVVTAGLVGGNLLLFSPLRIDNRIKAPAPPAQPENAAGPVFR